MKPLGVVGRTVLAFSCLAITVISSSAQTYPGTNQPGAVQDIPLIAGTGVTNLAIAVDGSATAFSHLLLKAGSAPSSSDFDFIAAANGLPNAINLEAPELKLTNYVLRVSTPTNSLAHSFTVTVLTNVADLRTARPATKPLASTNTGALGPGGWHYYRVEIPAGVGGWRVLLNSPGVSPDLYVQRDQVPTTGGYLKRSQSQTNDILAFTSAELPPGAYFIGVYQPSGSSPYTLQTELISLTTLTWDPGLTHVGTQVYTNNGTNNLDVYFKVTVQNTAVGAWRTALSVASGEASLYLSKGALPSPASSQFKSERAGSDGFVISASSFSAGEDWYFLVRATAGSQWTLVTGEPYVADLGTVAADGSSGSGDVLIGGEGMRFFKTTVPPDTHAWRLWLNGSTNLILLKKGFVPLPTGNELSQKAQLLVVPSYLVGGQLYFIGVPGSPGTPINLDSRQQPVTDIPFSATTSLSVTGFAYATFRVQVPVNQIAWQVSVAVNSGNPNVAVRRTHVPNELNNDAFSEVAGAVTDSVLLVPPTLSDGTFYVTIYGTNAWACQFTSGDPEITEINFDSVTTNTDTNRVGWRLFKVSDIGQQLGALGWDLFLTNFTPGTRIALRQNAAPGIWTYRNPSQGAAGNYDLLSAADFLQQPGHEAEVWYVGVYNPSNSLGAFTLFTRPLTADPIAFDSGSATRTAVRAGKWQFFRVQVPDTNTLVGWDVRLANVVGSPTLVIRREALPESLAGIGFSGTSSGTNWPGGNQWVAGPDWTARNFSTDGQTNESGRILTMGYQRPVDPGTYYIGVISANNSTNDCTYTLMTRGIGDGFTIPVQEIAYAGGAVTNNALAPRDLAVYRVQIPSNAPSWKVKLTTVTGESLFAVARDRMPNITASLIASATNLFTPGKKMQKTGNEHLLLLPDATLSNLYGGTYYLVVASEGVGSTNSTRIGTGDSAYILQSLGALPILELGRLGTNDIVLSDALEGGEVLGYRFTFAPPAEMLGFEVFIENPQGFPVAVEYPSESLPETGNQDIGYLADPYGNEGGVPAHGTFSDRVLLVYGTLEVYEDLPMHVLIKGRGVSGVWSNCTYTLRLKRIVPEPVTFDGAAPTLVTNDYSTHRFFRVDVPTNAMGWDIRLVNGYSNSLTLGVSRDLLPINLLSFWSPKTATNWPTGQSWFPVEDWTLRSLSFDGATNLDRRIMACGMGRPLEPGTYYVVATAFTVVSNLPTCGILSRGIGDGFTIPVTDLPFAGGSITNAGLEPKEAAYYRVVIPTNSTSWRVRVTPTLGEVMLVVMTNNLPSILTGTASAGGKSMQKISEEHFLFLPTVNQTYLKPGTNYLAVVSEGQNPANANTIGVGTSSFVIESLGELPITDLGTAGTVELVQAGSLAGGEVKAYRFNVPAGLQGLEAKLTGVTGFPAMVLRLGPQFPDPASASTRTGTGSVIRDEYGNAYGYTIAPKLGEANSGTITMANPSNGVCMVMVKARGSGVTYSNATFTLKIRGLEYTPVDFDGGSSVVTGQPPGTWRYFSVEVPTNVLGWDIRLTDVTSGLPKMVVRRDFLPDALTTTPWTTPSTSTNWPSTNQWAASSDWTRRTYNAANTISEDGRILAMGMDQPLVPGTYFIGVLSSGTGTNALSYTLASRGIGEGQSLPVVDLDYSGGSVTNESLLPREAAYYRVNVPSNSPGWKVKLSPTVGEAMLLVLKDRVPNVDSGRVTSGNVGKCMQKAGNEHYLLLPGAGQTNGTAGTYYLAVIGEGINPASSTRIGTGSSAYSLASLGDVTVTDLGTVSFTDLVSSNALEGGDCQIYRFTVPPTAEAVELLLANRVGNPVIALSSNSVLPNPGEVTTGQPDTYGNDGGADVANFNSSFLIMPNPVPGTYAVAVKARAQTSVYPDASYVMTVRQVAVQNLNVASQFNTNGLSNVASGLLLDGQRAFYRVEIPADVWGNPVLGWELNLAQQSGVPVVRVRKDLLPSDAVSTLMPFRPNAAVIVPPFLSPGTWYVEVRATNSTSYTLTSGTVAIQRPAWIMPGIGEPSVTPGLTAPDFADSGLDTNGVALPGDQGIDLPLGYYHYYAVTVPTNNGGLMRVQLDAISGVSDLYARLALPPTYSHATNGGTGTCLDRSVIGTGTGYANWVPINGLTQTRLLPGTWYLAVRASGTANARYRLRLSTGIVQDLDLYSGSLTNQTLAAGDWRYYRVQIPESTPANWHVTFTQPSGDVDLHVRDSIPPGNGATLNSSDYEDWVSDSKNSGPYSTYNAPGSYTFTIPPIRPGSAYYLGFRANSGSEFSVSSSTSGVTNPAPPIIPFYGGSVSNIIPAGGSVVYRILTPSDGLRWRHMTINTNLVQYYLENGTMPTRTTSDDYRGISGNSSLDRYLTLYPWLPNQTFYLVATNISASPLTFSFTMNGGSYSADDDADGLTDGWEMQYFGTLSQTPSQDYDTDGVNNGNEFLEGTNPADRTSFRPRLVILSTNGVVNVDPASSSNYTMGASVTLTGVPNGGYQFVSWGGGASGTNNPLVLVMNTNKTIIPRFRVPGDDFDQRIRLFGTLATHSGLSNASATKETGEPNHAGNPAGKSLWWTWTAPSAGTVTLTTAGSDFQNALAVYTGVAVSNLTPVASNLAGAGTNTAALTFAAAAGTTYHFAVDGAAGASGNVALNLSLPSDIILTNPLRQTNGLFQFTVIGPPGQVLRIDATTNFQAWITVITFTNTTGTTVVVDPYSTNFVSRYYRAAVADTSAPITLSIVNQVRLPDGQYSFTISGTPGVVLRVEAGTNLVNWATLATVTNTSGSTPFTDATATNYSRRFYRGVSP